MIERDHRLEKALLRADDELLYSVVALRSYRTGEQRFIGDAVLYMEELMEEAVHLLVEARPYERQYQSTWNLLDASATCLADRINFLGFNVLSQMRQMLYERAYSRHSPQRTTSPTWSARLRSWGCGAGQRRSGHEQAKREQHREREHLFSPNRQPGQDCGCLNYR